jgi:ribose 5-phosphate isomerase B
MRIALGNDHSGFPMKAKVRAILDELGLEVIDFGCHSTDPVDFPDISRAVCDAVRSGKADRGVLLCGTGVGASMAANKIPGIRAAVCHDVHCAHQGVEHDDMNVICLGAQIIGPWLAKDLIAAYVQARFVASEDYKRRVGKLHDLELAAARELKDQI